MNQTLNRLLKQATKLTESSDKSFLNAMRKQYEAALKDIESELQKIFLKFGDKPSMNDLYKFNRLKNLQLKIDSILKDSYKVSKSLTNQSIKTSLKEGYYTQSYAYYNSFQGAGITLNFGMFDPNVIMASELATRLPKSMAASREKITGYIFKNQENGKWLWEKSLKDSHAKAYTRINNAITQGLIKGDGYNKTAREVKKQLFNKKRGFNLTKAVQRIISTESGKARSLAGLLSYDEVKYSADKIGVKVQRVWLATLDNRVRDRHLALHNTPENENGQWIVNGTPTDAPQLTGNASDDINCRCDTATNVEGLESTYDESKVAKNLNKEKYEIWKKGQIKN